MKGLEPPRLAASDPKSDASTNSATPAKIGCKFNVFFFSLQIFLGFF